MTESETVYMGLGPAAAAEAGSMPPRPYVYSGRDRHDALAALAAGRESTVGPARLVVLAADAQEHATRSAAARSWLTGSGAPPEGVAFRETPLAGEVAFVYTNGAAAYPGMGRELMLAFPSIMDTLQARCGPLADIIGWAYADAGIDGAGTDGTGDKVHALDQIWGAGLLGLLHTEINRGLLGISPNAVIGYSSGESSALVAMGAWRDVPGLIAATRGSELFTSGLVGEFEAVRRVWRRLGVDGDQWMSYIVSAPPQDIRAALDGEPAVHVMAVNAPDSCVIGGEARGCERVISRLGVQRALPLDYEIAVHAPEVGEVREQWWRLHYRPTFEVPAVRFYSCATVDWYSPTPQATADALTAQALGTVDFAATVERAWSDGVRVFIEHGPRGLCSGWIRRILGDREHLAVAMDGHGVRHLASTVAQLLAAGVPMDANPLFEHLARNWVPGADSDTMAIPWPQRLPPTQTMPRAPRLPSVSTSAAPLAGTPAATSTALRRQPAPTLASDIYRRISARHQEFLTLQAKVHQRFLLSQRHTRTVLVTAHDAMALGEALASRAAPVPREPVPQPPARSHVIFDRAELEQLATGRISEFFGPRFAAQDDYPRQTRVPRPPVLLLDRVTRIDAQPASMTALDSTGKLVGTIRTETDVLADSWYLDATGRMPVGLMVEAAQGDLLLMSWLGIDLLTRGQRVYRLVTAELTFHDSPPVPGETLEYEIRLEGYGEHDGVCLSFFRVECRIGGGLRVTGRDCVAGFFTDDELSQSGGVLWDPAAEPCGDEGPLDPPVVACLAGRFGPDAVRAFADGRPADCFGPGWELTQSHVRSPRIADGRMLRLHEVTDFDPTGGPWRRGYLRAETPVGGDEWFFDGHFMNDPCMPGSLMFEGCLQAMAFYLAAMGLTIKRDGWRFEPVPDRPYRLRCRGQVTPENLRLTYEVFVSGLASSPEPTLFADVLCSVDGVKAFHTRRVGLRLVPDWPLSHWRQLGPPCVQPTGEAVAPRRLAGLRGYHERGPVAVVNGFSFDYSSILAHAWGPPSEAFGPAFAAFDGPRHIARLPAPPYSFISRVLAVDGPLGGMKNGSWAEVEYDVPDEVWYFEQNGYPTMPFGVLMEVALQPCGWLGCYVGSALTDEADLLLRNLDGTGTVTGEIRPGTRSLRTRAELRQVSQSAGVIIASFDVECFADGQPVFELFAVFGYFPEESFDNQHGLGPSEAKSRWLAEPCDRTVDLTARPSRYCEGEPRLAGPMLLMLDRVTGYWPQAGRAGLGRLRAEKDVDPGEWFFKAHFFQDPVQPGSLGVEAMCQLLQFYLIERDGGAGLRRPRFEPILPGRRVSWKYRGQVVPTSRRITVELEILAAGEDECGRYAVAQGWLWVDGKRIYEVENFGMRVIDQPLETG